MGANPSFFVVGAPKCGTTALCDYLRQHPQVYIPSWKEPHFFGSDLTGSSPIRDRDRYLALFEEGDGKVCGEGSVFYLFSRKAAEEIHAFDPAAKIIIMIRNPVDMMHALHSQLLFNGRHEDIGDFATALAAERDRAAGRRIPATCQRPEALRYREVATYAPQIERYLRVFGKDAVHTIILDDFATDALGEYRKVLRFLQVDEGFVPDIRVVNENKQVRSRFLRDLLVGRRMAPTMRRLRELLPSGVTKPIGHAIRDWNTEVAPRPPIDSHLRRTLLGEFADDIRSTGKLVSRDLNHWLD